MSLYDFRRGLRWAGEYITIGGGEPTIHPDFKEMINIALDEKWSGNIESITVIHNGKFAKMSKWLYNLTMDGVIDGHLSLDQYHDPIDQAVEDMWRRSSRIWNTTERREAQPAGRAIEEVYGYSQEDEDYAECVQDADCMCSTQLIKPDGKIYQCGCEDAPVVGDLESGPDIWVSDCHRSPEFQHEVLSADMDYLLV